MHYRWIILGTCCLITLYFTGTIYIGFTSAIEPLVREFGWSYTQISFAASLRGLETGLLTPIAGLMMDRWDPRRVIFCGALIAGAGFLLFSRVNTLAMFYACFIIIAIGNSAAPNALLMTTVAPWFDKHAGFAMGATSSGVSLGGLLLPAITFMIDDLGWRKAIFLMGLGIWIFILPLSLLIRRKPADNVETPLISSCNLIQDVPAREAEKDDIVCTDVRSVLKTGNFWVITLAFTCHVLVVTAVLTHIMPYLSTLGFDRTTASFIASALPILTVFGRVGFGWIGDRVNSRTAAFFPFIMLIAASLILGFTTMDRMWLISIFVLLFGIGWGGGVPLASCMIITYFGKARLNTLFGTAFGITTVGTLVGAPLAGWFFDNMGDYRPAWFIMSVIMGVGTIMFAWLLPYREQQNIYGEKHVR